MKKTYQERIKAALQDIVGALPKKTSELEQTFVRQFFAKIPIVELNEKDPKAASELAHDAFQFMMERVTGKPKIRVMTSEQPGGATQRSPLVVELINDDKPFLVDSLSASLIRQGFTIFETIHPMFHVARDASGMLLRIGDQQRPEQDEHRESFIHFELSSLPEDVSPETLTANLEKVLTYVRAAVADWEQMAQHAQEVEDMVRANLDKVDSKQGEEIVAFLGWLRDRNFVFLGYSDGTEKLGVSSLEETAPMKDDSSQLLVVTKSDRASLVHRPVLMDVITIYRPDGSGFHQFTGLFTSSVYYQSAEIIPLVRRKLASVLESAGYNSSSHDGKALKTILEFFPRDEIFQYDDKSLFEVAIGLLALEDRPGVRLFVRTDPFERYVSCMVFVPREHYSTELRLTIVDTITKAFQGKLQNFYTQMTESPLARLHIIVRTTPGFITEVDVEEIESDIARYTLSWSDELRSALKERYGEHRAETLMRRYSHAFPASYISRYSITATVFDIHKCVEACETASLSVDFFQSKQELDYYHLKIYSPVEEVALSEIVPMLEHMGFRAIDEHPFLITPTAGEEGGCIDIWIRDFKLKLPADQKISLDHIKPILEEAILKIWRREMANDSFNALVAGAGLSWRQVVVMRAFARYLRQIGFAYAQTSIEKALNAHPHITKNLFALFMTRFDPEAMHDDAKQEYLISQIENQLSQVSSLMEDRILRQYMKLILATLRTNYFQEGDKGGDKDVISFKFRSEEIPDIPKPVPYAEIFVYSMQVEGIHLRGGKVARGGIRWSDRREDFRTEVLGLMKAQMVKNSVIVPVGSKGGFVVKRPPTSGGREAFQQAGIDCYRHFLKGMLDITDNVVDGEVVPPASVKRHDGDDPYLVVAADKGTATFSDIANEISQSYQFWLDDAFASGGSAGYDHKKMGITARGAWVSVERHFKELGVNIDEEEFTVVGIGDMSGDVFGNGMLLSRNIRLLAAFNHLHIFIDPSPDAAKSYEERQRLFTLPRSSWQDYDASLISRGGGVYERSAKIVNVSKEAKDALGLAQDAYAPDELIQALLKAPVDLLWNGGIGTYVKSEKETHEMVGDRANNSVRVDGNELGCKVVGEGGNLGFTQRGRIEFAHNGGRINTDAIDNSGGVDCSDHEVNIKLAFARLLASDRLQREARNELLAEMTEEVAMLVLKDNFLQTQAITLSESLGVSQLEPQKRLIHRLEAEGLLDRGLEYLPDDVKIKELSASGQGLSRPEIAVLLSYAKIALYQEILASTLPDEEYFAVDLCRYFPKKMQQEFMEAVNEHPLRREIVATVATNSLVNRAGITFFFDIQEDMAKSTREVAAAYTFARDAFGLRSLWADIEKSNQLTAVSTQVSMLHTINVLIERVTLWGLRHLPQPIDVERSVEHYRSKIAELQEHVSELHSDSSRESYEAVLSQYKEANVPGDLAKNIAQLEMLSAACDLIDIAEAGGRNLMEVGKVYYAIGDMLHLGWIKASAVKKTFDSRWQRQALNSLMQEIYDEQRRLTAAILQTGSAVGDVQELMNRWLTEQGGPLASYQQIADDLIRRDDLDLSALMVALKHLKMLG